MKNESFPDKIKKVAKVAVGVTVLSALPTDASEDLTQRQDHLKDVETNQSVPTDIKKDAPAIMYDGTVVTNQKTGVLIENNPSIEPDNPEDDALGGDDDKDVVSVEDTPETVVAKNTPETKLAPEVMRSEEHTSELQ